ncbi:hypothetical protein BDR26DRAFT_929398 [Obelidium mucronatum]|nr:hypothetical protein BDR26DRAFT_929398 [Obelidium mucronatum]
MSNFQFRLAAVIVKYEKPLEETLDKEDLDAGIPLNQLGAVSENTADEYDEYESEDEVLHPEEGFDDEEDVPFNADCLRKEFWSAPVLDNNADSGLPVSPPPVPESNVSVARVLNTWHVYLARQKEARSNGKNLKCQHCDTRLDIYLHHQRETCRVVCRYSGCEKDQCQDRENSKVLKERSCTHCCIPGHSTDDCIFRNCNAVEFSTYIPFPWLSMGFDCAILVRIGWIQHTCPFWMVRWVLTARFLSVLDGFNIPVRFGWFDGF